MSFALHGNRPIGFLGALLLLSSGDGILFVRSPPLDEENIFWYYLDTPNMEKKSQNSTQNSLFDQIRLMKGCPLCKKDYTREALEIVEEGIGTHLVHLTCTYCSNAMLALIVVSKLGMSSVGMLTDLNAPDARRLHHKAAIGEDMILGFHDYLTQNSKEFIHLLKS